MKIKNTSLEVVDKDILDIETGAIIIPYVEDLEADNQLNQRVLDQGGESILVEIKRQLPVKPGEGVLTTAGNLKAKNVIHVALAQKDNQTDQDQLRAAVASALDCAQKLNLTSITFGALGSQFFGFPPVGAAKILLQELFKVCQHKKTSLTEVVIAIDDKELNKVFQETIAGYLKHIQEELGPGPYVTTDIIIEVEGGVILIERSNPPYGWALPGGFLDYGESLEESAIREAKEETNLDLEDLKQFHTYSKMGRDPRFQTITTVFTAKGIGKAQFGDDAQNLKIVPLDELPKLEYAFDHKEIITEYLNSLK